MIAQNIANKLVQKTDLVNVICLDSRYFYMLFRLKDVSYEPQLLIKKDMQY